MIALTFGIGTDETMSTEGDSGWLGPLTTALTFAAGAVGALFMRSLGWARGEGVNVGAMKEWRDRKDQEFRDIRILIDEQKSATKAMIEASEARLSARMSMIEARKDRIDESFRTIPDREEMNEGFDRIRSEMSEGMRQIRDQISELSGFVHNRNSRPYIPPSSGL